MPSIKTQSQSQYKVLEETDIMNVSYSAGRPLKWHQCGLWVKEYDQLNLIDQQET